LKTWIEKNKGLNALKKYKARGNRLCHSVRARRDAGAQYFLATLLMYNEISNAKLQT
jgi:hypothetical protein